MKNQNYISLFIFFWVFFAFINHAFAANTTNDSFNKAKKMLEREVYPPNRVTIYCGAEFDERKNVILPDGFETPAHEKRASKIEWEHAVPAEHFGQAFLEWREGHPECVDNRGNMFKGRKCAEKMNMEYRFMQSDMYNLFPAIGSVNAMRSNKQYAALTSDPVFGSCEAKVEGKHFEPPNRAKGQVARASLYMDAAYPRYSLSRQQKRLFNAWNASFPPEKAECERVKKIERLQGNENPIVKKECEKQNLW